MQQHSNETDYGIDGGLLMAGFFGALILAMTTKNQTPGKAVTSVMAGAISANYLTPVVLHFMPEYIQNNARYGTAFIMGFIGLKTLEIIYDLVSNKIKSKKGKINIDISM
jgi:Na+/proline symporter